MTDEPQNAPPPEHYLDRLAAVGERAGLVTSEPLTDRNGMVLAGSGTRMTAELRDRLVRHKLLRPIDESLQSSDPVTIDRLLDRARLLLDSQPLLRRLGSGVPDVRRLLAVLGSVDIPEPLQIKLTVAAATDARRLDHLLLVTLTALAIGQRHALPPNELKSLALAGILHDLGELHIDPAIFAPSTTLSAAMRRQVEAHPVIMHAVLDSFGRRYADAARAILEHHERVDGSGYPRGRRGDQLSQAGQVLALAEFLVSLHTRRECTHTIIALKLQRHHFDPALVETAFRMLGSIQTATDAPEGTFAELVTRLQESQTVLTEWLALSEPDDDLALPERDLSWLHDRAATIQRHFTRLGIHTDDLERSLEPIADDSDAIAELTIVADEIRYQIIDTTWEFHRRVDAKAIETLPAVVRRTFIPPDTD